MTSSSWLILPALAGAIAGVGGGAVPPSTAHYRLEVKSEQIVDLTAVGQTEQRSANTTLAYLTVMIADSAGGNTLIVMVDSVQLDSTLGVPKAMVDSLRGQSRKAYVGPDGKVVRQNMGSAPALLLALGLDGVIRRLAPPSVAHRKTGAAWTDTTDVTDTLPNGSISTRIVTNFQSSEDTYEGGKALKVAGAYSTALRGDQAGPGGEGTFDGTGTGTSSWFYSTDGLALGGTSHTAQQITYTGGGAPAPIPITASTDVTLTRQK
ncbi:MAG: hypothetical protein ACHQ2E_02070 [Gemmatimonadales bacterium]